MFSVKTCMRRVDYSIYYGLQEDAVRVLQIFVKYRRIGYRRVKSQYSQTGSVKVLYRDKKSDVYSLRLAEMGCTYPFGRSVEFK